MTVERDNYAVFSAVSEMENFDMARELEEQITAKILESGKSGYDNFSASVTLKEFDAENSFADYEVEISYTDYGEFDKGSPSHDYYDPPDPPYLDMDDTDEVLYDMKNFIENSFGELGFDAEAEEVEYEIESIDNMLEELCEPPEPDYEYDD